MDPWKDQVFLDTVNNITENTDTVQMVWHLYESYHLNEGNQNYDKTKLKQEQQRDLKILDQIMDLHLLFERRFKRYE